MNKYKLGDNVRVINENHQDFDDVGVILELISSMSGLSYEVAFSDWHRPTIREQDLTLADPDVHETLDQMDAESVASVWQMPRTGVTAEDKLRLIADTVDAQTPSGTELANFRRRLFAILSIGHDA